MCASLRRKRGPPRVIPAPSSAAPVIPATVLLSAWYVCLRRYINCRQDCREPQCHGGISLALSADPRFAAAVLMSSSRQTSTQLELVIRNLLRGRSRLLHSLIRAQLVDWMLISRPPC